MSPVSAGAPGSPVDARKSTKQSELQSLFDYSNMRFKQSLHAKKYNDSVGNNKHLLKI